MSGGCRIRALVKKIACLFLEREDTRKPAPKKNSFRAYWTGKPTESQTQICIRRVREAGHAGDDPFWAVAGAGQHEAPRVSSGMHPPALSGRATALGCGKRDARWTGDAGANPARRGVRIREHRQGRWGRVAHHD